MRSATVASRNGGSCAPSWSLRRSSSARSSPGELDGLVDAPARQRKDRPSVAAEDDLLRRALHDDLTGLLNRELFLDGVRVVLSGGANCESMHGIIAVHVRGSRPDGVPLDRVATEEVLVEVASRMTGTVRWTDSVARVGDHQLAALIQGRSVDEIAVVAARILDRVSGSVDCGRRPVTITANVGTEIASPGADADVVLLHAEQAMRTAIVSIQPDGHMSR